jgi:hypothetical protein
VDQETPRRILTADFANGSIDFPLDFKAFQ